MSLVLANTLGAKVTSFDIPSWLAFPFNVIFSPVIWIFNFILEMTGNNPLSYSFFNTISVSVGILTVPLMFLVIDIVHEVWGKKTSKEFINVGVFAMILMIFVTWLSVVVPVGRFAGVSPDKLEVFNEAYTGFFSVSIRMAIASILAFYLSQITDILIFHFWRKKMHEKFYWIRKNVSTFISEMIDSTVFMFVAFYHPENFPAAIVIKLILPYYIFKALFSVLDTPLAYLGVWWAKKEDKVKV